MKGISSATAVLLHCWSIWRSFVRQQFLWIRIWRILNYLIVPRRIASSSPYSVGRGLAHNSTNLHCSPSSRLPPPPPPLWRYPFYMLISWIPPVKRNWYSPFPGTYLLLLISDPRECRDRPTIYAVQSFSLSAPVAQIQVDPLKCMWHERIIDIVIISSDPVTRNGIIPDPFSGHDWINEGNSTEGRDVTAVPGTMGGEEEKS